MLNRAMLLRFAFLAALCWGAMPRPVRAAQDGSAPAANAASSADSSASAPVPVMLSPGPYYIGAIISATFVVPNAADRPQINLDQIRDFESRIFDAKPLPESAPQPGYVVRLNLLPKKPGELRVPSLIIRGTAHRRITEPFTVDVAEPEPAREMTLAATLSEPTCFVGQPVTLEVTWTLGSEVGTVHAVDLRVPLIEHPDYKSRDFAAVPKDFGMPIGLPVSNSRVIGGVAGRTIRFRKIIVPQKAGTFSIPGVAVLSSVAPADSTQKRTGFGSGFQYGAHYDNQFFSDAGSANAKRLYARSAPLKVQVRPLPEAGKPADFSGIIGAFTLHGAADPTTLREGEPLTFTVRVRDYGYAEVIEIPRFARLPGFRGRFRIPAERAVPTLENTDNGPEKVFRQSFRPISTGVDKIPAISISFFEPTTATYRFATVPEIPLQVLPHSVASGFDAVLSDGGRLKNILVSSGPAIGPNFSQDEILRPAFATWVDIDGFWLVLIIPPLACAALIGATRRWRCRRLSPERERVLWAYPDFLHALRRATDPAALTKALHAYLSRRLGIAVVTFGAVEHPLRERGVAERDMERLREVLESGDRRNFSADGGSTGKVILSGQTLRSLVSSIEAAFGVRRSTTWRFCAVWPLFAVAILFLTPLRLRAALPPDALAEAETWFQTGVEQRFDHPEAAKDAFTKAAAAFEYSLALAQSGIERGKLHYNAGAARFFSEDIGRSLYHLRMAQRLLPADKRIHSALAFVRYRQPESTAGNRDRRVWDYLLPLGEVLNPASRKLLLAATYATFWALVAIVAFRPERIWRRLVAAPVIVGCILAVSLGVEGLSARLRDEGIVLEPELVARRGPASIYEPAFETPIHAGAEFRVIGQRYGWLEIVVSGAGEPCWIPAKSAIVLDP